MKQLISLKPVEMTKAVMQHLESKGLILRMSPDTTPLNAKPGQTVCSVIHSSKDEYGPHKLMFVTVNRKELTEFGTHPDHEDFFLIGKPGERPLYLVIALCLREELDKKIQRNTLTPEDFITLKVRHNDPEVSFFTMLKDVPHGEAIGHDEGEPASFYVGESRDLPDVDTDFKNYELVIKE